MSFEADALFEGEEGAFVERRETGVRMALALLFLIVLRIVETVLGIAILFELVATLITRRPPGPRVREFANRTLSYAYRILRYLTYNEETPPFPFRDFPAEVEPTGTGPAS